jgi:hypothetical protein
MLPNGSIQTQHDQPHQLAEGSWQMWAEARPNGEFWYLGNRNSVPIDRMGRAADVVVNEDPKGSYWGWLATGETIPSHIWPTKETFLLFFRQDPAEAEQQGEGHVLRLTVERQRAEKQRSGPGA